MDFYLPQDFLNKELINNEIISNLKSRGLESYLQQYNFPFGSVIFYSLALDALIAINTATSDDIKVQILRAKIFAESSSLELLEPAELKLPDRAINRSYSYPIAKVKILEIVLSLGGVIIDGYLFDDLLNLDPVTESMLLVASCRNIRLRESLADYFLKYLADKTDNIEAALAGGYDPIPGWIKYNIVGLISQEEGEYLKQLLSTKDCNSENL